MGRLSVIGWLLILVCLSLAVEAKDKIVVSAELDIARFEKQAKGLSSARAASARRLLKLMNLSIQRLQQSKNHNDPSWKSVAQRFASLKAQLEGLPGVSNALQASEGVVAQKAVTVKPAEALTGKKVKSVRPLVSGERVRINKLLRDILSVSVTVVTTGPSLLQDPVKVAAYKKRLNQFAQALGRYPQIDDNDVKAARLAYQNLRKKLSDEFNRAKEQLAKLGNVQQRLASLDANYKKYRIPPILSAPFSEDDAQAWVKQAGEARTSAEHSLKELADIGKLAYLPNNPGTPQSGAPYDANDVKRLQQGAQSTLKKIEIEANNLIDRLENRLKQIENEVLTRFQEDPNGDKRWVFIGEGRKKLAFSTFDKSMGLAKSALYIEQALGKKAERARAVIDKIRHAKNSFIKRRDIALRTSRLPEPQSTDSKRLEIARKILKKPKYKFGEFGRIILTSKQIIDRERKDSEIKIDDAQVSLGGDVKMSGTKTTWTYKWKEFSFAVPIKEENSDIWYIWWITAKNFSSGGNRTPLNQWISGKATKGNQILKANG